MKAQDIVILLKLILLKENSWRMTDLAASLGLSQSEISKSLKRLEKAKLYNAKSKSIARNAFYELLIYGVPYFFPTETGKITKGISTAISHNFVQNKIVSDTNYVWPDIEGDLKGETVTPLYPGAIQAAKKDKELHLLLALIDLLRIGRAREITLARNELKKRILE